MLHTNRYHVCTVIYSKVLFTTSVVFKYQKILFDVCKQYVLNWINNLSYKYIQGGLVEK